MVIAGAGPAGLVAAVTLARYGIVATGGAQPGPVTTAPGPRPSASAPWSCCAPGAWRTRSGPGSSTSPRPAAFATETLASPDGTPAAAGLPRLRARRPRPARPRRPPCPRTTRSRSCSATWGGSPVAEVRFGTELAAFDQDDGGVTVTLQGAGAGGADRACPGRLPGRRRRRPLAGPDRARHRHGRPRPPGRAACRCCSRRRWPRSSATAARHYLVQHPRAGGVRAQRPGDCWLYKAGTRSASGWRTTPTRASPASSGPRPASPTCRSGLAMGAFSFGPRSPSATGRAAPSWSATPPSA